jgi:phosphatidate cytidylyltransferase
MKTRAITAFFFTIVMLGSIFLGAYTFTGFYLLLSVLALAEFYKLIRTADVKPHAGAGLILSGLVFLLIAAYHFFEVESKYLLLLIPLISSVFLFELYRKAQSPFTNIAYTFTGLFFVTIPFCFYYSLGFLSDWNLYNFHLPLAFLLMLWASDTGA